MYIIVIVATIIALLLVCGGAYYFFACHGDGEASEPAHAVNIRKRILYITQTAVMLALLITAQFSTGFLVATGPLGQFVTGSVVNLILLVTVFTAGIYSGLTVAALSPFFAFSVGIGPALIQIVPFLAIGNVIIVLIAWFFRKRVAKKNVKDIVISAAGLLTAGGAKALFLWVGITIVVLPLLPGLSQKQITVMSTAFSWTQLVTASIGGALCLMIMPLLKKALRKP